MNGCWEVAVVDRSGDYFELRYGDMGRDPPESLTPIALVGKGTGTCFSVEWLVDPTGVSHREAIEHTRAELDFYLVEKQAIETWSYLKYHTTTASNLYSHVHWIFHQRGK